jgi:hypothetical protein
MTITGDKSGNSKDSAGLCHASLEQISKKANSYEFLSPRLEVDGPILGLEG